MADRSVLFLLLVSCFTTLVWSASTNYIIGTGIADVTGPAAEVDLMGYANPSQTSAGIHMRQYSRAFIVADNKNKTRVVFVSIDACMISQILKIQVVKKLKTLYGSLYDESNVCLSGIHTHSGPGGFHQYVLLDVTSLGFVNESLVALTNGIVKSIQRAHNNMAPGNIYMNEGELLDSNINRSPTAYVANPKEERARYKYDVDKNMTVLKFVDANNQGIAMISWFAVHCTSMNNTNLLISSDNKGYASQMFEAEMNKGSLPGKGKFIAAFAQSNLGDVSPNIRGPHCTDTGKPCDLSSSTCQGKNEYCVASGPGKDMTESTKIIGENQFKMAMDLYNGANAILCGPVDFRHQFVNMSDVTVKFNATTTVKTCRPAMGYSFAAGTTDGPGMFNFKQGTTTGNAFWNIIRDFIHEPSDAQIACQHPKPILLDTGETTEPYPWQPEIVATQLLRIGQLGIIAVPGEFTTMSGRRTRDAVKEALFKGGFPSNLTTVVAGLSNDYADYITTYEEFQVQRYEGASTIFGPHTLQAYINQFVKLANAMTTGTTVEEGPAPPNYLDNQISLLPGVIFDRAGFGNNYGDVIKDVTPKYETNTSVSVSFISANPRNDVRAESSFLTIEQQDSHGNWTVIATDSSWSTKYEWLRTSTVLGESKAIITWDIPANQPPGTYRIKHFGNHKEITGDIVDFDGTSSQFKVVSAERAQNKDINRTKFRTGNFYKWNRKLFDRFINRYPQKQKTYTMQKSKTDDY